MALPHPCPIWPGNCGCHECWLYRHDPRYRALWGGNPLDTDPAPMPLPMQKQIIEQVRTRSGNSCWHLGEPLEASASCGCGGAVKRQCAIFGECRQYGSDPTLPNCSRCESYVPRPDPTAEDWAKRLRTQAGIIPPHEARQYRPEFTQAVHIILRELRENLPVIPRFASTRGVVTSGGGKYWPGAWIQAAILREYGWTDPIQAWYLGAAEADPFWQAECNKLGVVCVDAREFDRGRLGVKYRILNGFEVKLFACVHSGIEQPLWLDSDCYPCRPVDHLWECPEYKRTGSIHWPDLSNADQWTQWEKWGIKKDDSPPLETGQYLYDLPRVWEEVQIALKLNEISDLTYHWDYGDKGPPRVAWALTGKPRAIYRRVPDWIGPAFVHVDHQGIPALIHRCRGKAAINGKQFYTPQHHDGEHEHHALPSESIYQHYLAKARALHASR